MKISGVEWMKMKPEQKQKYEGNYKKEWEVYLQELQKYKSSMTEEQKMKINDYKMGQKEIKIQRGVANVNTCVFFLHFNGYL